MSTGYHPQTDGQTERTNRTLEDMLRCFVTEKAENWSDVLPMLEFAYNDASHSSTQYTLFFLTTGRHPHTPAKLLTLTPADRTARKLTDEFFSQLHSSLAAARKTI